MEEVGNGNLTVVDGKFFAGTALMSRGTEAEGRGLEDGQLNTDTNGPVERRPSEGQALVNKQQSEGRVLDVDQLNTCSLESVVGQRSEGQVLADTRQSDGQVLKGEHLNAADLRPTSLLNSLSLGHFAGQRPEGQASADEQSDPSRRRRAASQPSDRVYTPIDNQPHARLVTVDVHEHPSSRGASVNFNNQQPRQPNNFSDMEGDTSEDSDPGNVQHRSHSRVQQVLPPCEGRNGIQSDKVLIYNDDVVFARRYGHQGGVDGAHISSQFSGQLTTNNFPRSSSDREAANYSENSTRPAALKLPQVSLEHEARIKEKESYGNPTIPLDKP